MRPLICALLLVAAFAVPASADDKKRQDEFCHNEYLTRQQQASCVDQAASVESMDDLKKLQKRYRDEAKKAQEAQEAAKK